MMLGREELRQKGESKDLVSFSIHRNAYLCQALWFILTLPQRLDQRNKTTLFAGTSLNSPHGFES